MNRSHGTLWTGQRAESLADRYPQALLLGVLVLLIVFGALGLRGAGPLGAGPSAASPHLVGAHASVAPMGTTSYGGALTVSSGENLTIGPSTGHLTYYEGGNLTVASGGTLNLRNTTLVFDEFVGNGGSVGSQLSHIYSLTDSGTIVLVNSSITTFVSQTDPFPVLTVTITGVFDMTRGSLEFPGSIDVVGGSASFWIDHVGIGRNPAVSQISSNGSANVTGLSAAAFKQAVSYGPTIRVTGGAQATWLASSVNDTFADPLNGTTLPGVAPSQTASGGVLNAGLPTPLVLPLPSNATSALALDAVYPSVVSGTATFAYNATATGTTSDTQFIIGSSAWTFAPITFPASAGSTVRAPIPAAASSAINAMGVDAYLSTLATGHVLVTLGTSSAPVTVHSVTVGFVAPWSFNITVSGAGSTLTAADTSIDANWDVTPGVPGPTQYVPWESNKLLLSNGAQAYLANVSVPFPTPVDFDHQSFVVPDPTSAATFYRWLEVPVRGAGGIIVQGATVQASYAYSGAGSENATVTALNTLATADPVLAQYVTSWDRSVGVSTYGEVDAQGNASLLLASSGVLNSSLPDGNFLGDYHVGVTANPGSSAISQWFS
ncbi:MAG TPA: hypothetical protein VGS23_06790, partial [Thermoplasmata archaeon]|nr:hypothetical protein [Thermoplasmata archaeon]